MGQDDNSKPIYKETTYLNVRGILKKRLMPVLLRNKFSDFARIRYVTIDEIVSLDGSELDLPLTLRSRVQLAMLIERERMPINPDEYMEVDELRTDIKEYLEDAQAFLASKAKKDKKRQEEKAFMEMNELDEPLPPQKVKKEKPKGQALKNSRTTQNKASNSDSGVDSGASGGIEDL